MFRNLRTFEPNRARRWANTNRQRLASTGRILAPMLVAFAFATAAHAQGSIDMSGATTLMNTFKTFAMYAGAVICLGSLIFAGIKMMSGKFQQAIPGLFGALFGAGVLGWGAGWISYTQEYLDASSPRSQQIRDYLERTGFQGPEAAQIAAHGTRDGKELHSTAEVMAAHYKVAAAYGQQAARVVQAAHARSAELGHRAEPQGAALAQQAVSYAKDRGFEREAVSDERLLMRDALRRGMGDVTYPEVRRDFEHRVAAGEFRSVPGSKHATGRQFTTPETMALKRSTVRSLLLGQDTIDPMLPSAAAARQAASRPQLNDGQRRAIDEILTSRDRVQGLQGLAGTGKTTALSAIREGAELGGYAVEGFAPTSKASNQLREAGISATTLQRFLKRGGGERASGDTASQHLYMLDESSLVSTRQMRDFLAKIGPQYRVLVIGDTRQHQGVEAGKPFEQMQDAGMRTALLDTIMRQRDPQLLAAVEKLSKNETAAGVEMLQQQGRVYQVVERADRIAAIAREYASRPENTIIVSPDNASRREINRTVRSELQERELLSRSDHLLPTLIPRNELTGADRLHSEEHTSADAQIICSMGLIQP